MFAERFRPRLFSLETLTGHARQLWLNELARWRAGQRFHFVLWGPPGIGKTTLGLLLAESTGLHVTVLSAVKAGVKEIRAAVEQHPGQLLFIDEIHRLSKSQQDVLLPILEHSEAWVIGATTESPTVTLNPAVLSRLRTIHVRPPSSNEIQQTLERVASSAHNDGSMILSPEKTQRLLDRFYEKIARSTHGDLRLALNTLEQFIFAENETDELEIFSNLQHAFTSKIHHDWASAMIKSMRGSDPDAALFYAMTALDGGEDPLFILRRCIIFASEDVGNADPTALSLAVNAYSAMQAVGLPEGRIPMAQAVTYLASTVKSNRSYVAIEAVRAWRTNVVDAIGQKALAPPRMLTIAGKNEYQYPHSFPHSFVKTEYLPEAVAKLRQKEGPAYKPGDNGIEAKLRARLAALWS